MGRIHLLRGGQLSVRSTVIPLAWDYIHTWSIEVREEQLVPVRAEGNAAPKDPASGDEGGGQDLGSERRDSALKWLCGYITLLINRHEQFLYLSHRPGTAGGHSCAGQSRC